MSAPTSTGAFDLLARVPRVIAVEEHSWTSELRAALLDFGGDETVASLSAPTITSDRLLDVGEERLARMDAAGVDVQVLSITTPGTQPLEPAAAVPLARDANDHLFEAVRRRPDRFAAFATLPTPDPAAAADELRRCVRELGFVGAMVFPEAGRPWWITTAFARSSSVQPNSTCRSTSIPAYRPRPCATPVTAGSTSRRI